MITNDFIVRLVRERTQRELAGKGAGKGAGKLGRPPVRKVTAGGTVLYPVRRPDGSVAWVSVPKG